MMGYRHEGRHYLVVQVAGSRLRGALAAPWMAEGVLAVPWWRVV